MESLLLFYWFFNVVVEVLTFFFFFNFFLFLCPWEEYSIMLTCILERFNYVPKFVPQFVASFFHSLMSFKKGRMCYAND